jgi:tellurite resistance protein TerB
LIIPIWIPLSLLKPSPRPSLSEQLSTGGGIVILAGIWTVRYARRQVIRASVPEAEGTVASAREHLQELKKTTELVLRVGNSPEGLEALTRIQLLYPQLRQATHSVRKSAKRARSAYPGRVPWGMGTYVDRLYALDRAACDMVSAAKHLHQAANDHIADLEWKAAKARRDAAGRARSGSLRHFKAAVLERLAIRQIDRGITGSVIGEAAMAACALVAAADGVVSEQERNRVFVLLDYNRVLSRHDSRHLARMFSEFCEDLRAKPESSAHVENSIGQIRGDDESAAAVLEIARTVGATGGLAPVEAAALERIRALLNLRRTGA